MLFFWKSNVWESQELPQLWSQSVLVWRHLNPWVNYLLSTFRKPVFTNCLSRCLRSTVQSSFDELISLPCRVYSKHAHWQLVEDHMHQCDLWSDPFTSNCWQLAVQAENKPRYHFWKCEQHDYFECRATGYTAFVSARSCSVIFSGKNFFRPPLFER